MRLNQMPPRLATRRYPTAQLGPSAIRGDVTSSVGDLIARALDRMAEVMEHVTENTRRLEPGTVNKED
jgi:hypothetical protein